MFRVSTLDPDNPPKDDAGRVDYSQDFFDRPSYLTVSGQLEAEIYATALGKSIRLGQHFGLKIPIPLAIWLNSG